MFNIVKNTYADAELEFKIGKYYADIAIPSLNVVIEWDGGGHWLSVYKGVKTLDQKKHEDLVRDDFMYTQGWHVLRFNDKTGYSHVLEDIRRVSLNSTNGYSFEDIEVVSIENLNSYHIKNKSRLYDITVEEDHSFVVSGVVSHNCKLTYLPKGFGFNEKGKIEFKSLDHDEFKIQREIYGLPR